MELTLYFLRLAPIVRPAPPSARAGTMMAAIRTKFEVALERSRFPESDWTVVGITAAYLLTAPSQQLADMPAPPPPNKAGGCCKELPETRPRIQRSCWRGSTRGQPITRAALQRSCCAVRGDCARGHGGACGAAEHSGLRARWKSWSPRRCPKRSQTRP